MEWLLALEASFGEVAAFIAAGVAIIAGILAAIFKPFKWLAARKTPPETRIPDAPPSALGLADGHSILTPEVLDELLEARIAKRLMALEAAPGDEKTALQAQIDELRRQRRDLEKALLDAQAHVKSLEEKLDREANTLDSDKLATARAALATGDYAAADTLFAEIEARAAIATQSAARAAFARGEIAEAEVRWADAAKHYARAAELEPSVQALRKASDFARRSGDFHSALCFGETALEHARKGSDMTELVTILKDHASVLIASGRSDEAEPLYHQALKIGEASQGKEHSDYADSLFNLAALLDITDRSDEAKPLYRQAREIAARHRAF